MKLRTIRTIISDETIGLSRSFGETIGQLVDQRIATALLDGATLQTINVEFTSEEWQELVENGEERATVKPPQSAPNKPSLGLKSSRSA